MNFRTNKLWDNTGRYFVLTRPNREYRLYLFRKRPCYARFPFEIQLREPLYSNVFISYHNVPKRKR